MRPASRPVARLTASFAATLGLTVATVMWSESVFWGRWRPGDSFENLLWTIAGYGAIVQVVRFVAARTSVATTGRGAWRRVFLVGALFGWLVEGVLVTTVVDELPLTLSHTGLSWHAIVTVLLGWWAIPRLLERRPAVSLASLAAIAAVGACVGAWAAFWRFEDGDVTPVPEYAAYVTLLTLGYAAGLALWWGMRGRATPSVLGTAPAALVLLGIAVVHAVERPITLLGPLLVGIAVLALVTTRPRAPQHELLPTGGAAPFPALWRLAILPVAAVGVFAGFSATPQPIPTGWPFFAVGVILGTVLFIRAWWGGVRARRAVRPDSDD